MPAAAQLRLCATLPHFDSQLFGRKLVSHFALTSALVEEPDVKESKPEPSEMKMRFLARGAFGQVFEVSCGGRRCAVKRQSNELCGKQWRVPAEVRAELVILRTIRNGHPNVLSLLSWSTSGAHTDLFFDLYSCSLRHFIDTERSAPTAGLSSVVACALARDLSAGLAFVHGRSIWHRDLKPANCLVRRKPLQCVLSDFGAACAKGSRDQSDNVTTLWYRSPEILLGSRQYSDAADCWSLGCVLWEMVFATPAFQGRTEIEMLFQIFQRRGTPCSRSAPSLTMLPFFRSTLFPSWRPSQDGFRGAALGAHLGRCSFGRDLFLCVSGLLTLELSQRMSARILSFRLSAAGTQGG